jgi:predicted transcriptional regulator
MAEDLEISESGKIDNKLLLSALLGIRRDQREIKELVVALTKHVAEVEKRLAKRIDDVKDRLETMFKPVF